MPTPALDLTEGLRLMFLPLVLHVLVLSRIFEEEATTVSCHNTGNRKTGNRQGLC